MCFFKVGGFVILRYFVDCFFFINEIYNELWEDEKWINDVKIEDNYYYLDLWFVKEDVNFVLYDYVIVGLDGNKDLIEFG